MLSMETTNPDAEQYRNGDRTPPCWTPCIMLKGLDVCWAQRTVVDAVLYQLLINRQRWPLTPLQQLFSVIGCSYTACLNYTSSVNSLPKLLFVPKQLYYHNRIWTDPTMALQWPHANNECLWILITTTHGLHPQLHPNSARRRPKGSLIAQLEEHRTG